MPHWSIAAAIASGPIVKLRLTGTLPAMSAAMFASAPPTDAGSSRPTISLGSGVLRGSSARAAATPTSVRP